MGSTLFEEGGHIIIIETFQVIFKIYKGYKNIRNNGGHHEAWEAAAEIRLSGFK